MKLQSVNKPYRVDTGKFSPMQIVDTFGASGKWDWFTNIFESEPVKAVIGAGTERIGQEITGGIQERIDQANELKRIALLEAQAANKRAAEASSILKDSLANSLQGGKNKTMFALAIGLTGFLLYSMNKRRRR